MFHEEFILHDTQVDHNRVVYSLFGVLGDVGGVLQAIMMLFISIFTSYSEFSFVNSLISKLFYVNTKDKKIIKKKDDFDYKKTSDWPIKISNCDKFRIFCRCCPNKKQKKLIEDIENNTIYQ